MINDHYGSGNIVVQRATEASDDAGGTNRTWATHLTLDGVIQPIGASQRANLMRLEDVSTHKLYTDVKDIVQTDRIVSAGITYKITGRPINPGNKDHHLETSLEIIE